MNVLNSYETTIVFVFKKFIQVGNNFSKKIDDYGGVRTHAPERIGTLILRLGPLDHVTFR
jgi:hypothetical protein